jgi:hypothetical protein
MPRVPGTNGSSRVDLSNSDDQGVVTSRPLQPSVNNAEDDQFDLSEWKRLVSNGVRVTESLAPPAGLDPKTIPSVGNVKYYVASSRAGRVQHTYEYWVQRDDAGEVLASEWIRNEAHATPDFAWTPSPKEHQVNITRVYEIYLKSVAKESSSEL